MASIDWSALGGAGKSSGAVVDDAPAYDGLISLSAVALPRYLRGAAEWRAWAETTASGLSVEHWRLARKWFAEVSIGSALAALIPLLTGARDLADLADALEAMPLGDVARLAATADLIDPQTPLDAADLLALRGDLPAARRFCDRYLREIGRRRAAIVRALADPEGVRAELVGLLRVHHERVYSALDARLREERARGATALRAQIERAGGAPPTYIRGRDDLAGFWPVVIGVSTILGDGLTHYYHDIDRSLFDVPGELEGRAQRPQQSYEPFIAIVGARRALGVSTRRRGVAPTEGAARFADPAERWAALYTALGDPSRLKIVRALVERPRYGQELAVDLGMSTATISHHLGALNKAGVLAMERRAHRTYFTLDARALQALLRQGEGFALGLEDGAADRARGLADDAASPDAREGMA